MFDFIKKRRERAKEKQELIIADQKRIRHNQTSLKSYHKRVKEKQERAREKQTLEDLATYIVRARTKQEQGESIQKQKEINFL